MEIHGTDPPCGQCRPQIHENNMETWNVVNTFGIESSGNILYSILEISRLMPVHDVAEVFLKASELISSIRSYKEI